MYKYSIRYLFKKDGSQIAFWDKNVGCVLTAMTTADRFVSTTSTETLADTGWVCEEPNFWRRKIVFVGSAEETSFALHISVGREIDSHKANF